MKMLSETSKHEMLASVAEIQSAINAFAAGRQRLLAAYDSAAGEVYAAHSGIRASNLASTIGPDRLNESIRGALNAAGLSDLLKATAMRGSDERNVVKDLTAHWRRLLAGV